MESDGSHRRALEGHGKGQGPSGAVGTYGQMDDCGIYYKKHLMDWEHKENHEKTWGEMKTYFGDEYEALLKYEPSLGGTLESANELMEGQTTQQQRGATRQQAQMEVTQFFEELRRDAIVGTEQIQQMSEAFTGATGTMKEVMERLKEEVSSR